MRTFEGRRDVIEANKTMRMKECAETQNGSQVICARELLQTLQGHAEQHEVADTVRPVAEAD